MKAIFKRLVYQSFLWTIIEAILVRPAVNLKVRRQAFIDFPKQERYLKELQRISPDLTVCHGPFKGMKYPKYTSVGSVLFPKLLGSYERELQPIIESLLDQPYTRIVDIGCAEGYYAVGLARRFPVAQVFAFDIDEEARAICHLMAQANDVDDRVTIRAKCSPEVLASFSDTQRTLVIADCEGYEKTLFNERNVKALTNCDFLVEVHDCFDITISPYLEELFTSHGFKITKILSVDDIVKAHRYDYEELAGNDLKTRKSLLAENRPAIMQWFFVTKEDH